MITFEEWWLMQFLPKEHRYSSEQAWNKCHREMEQLSNLRVAETIASQQATIDRLTEQRDRLFKWLQSATYEVFNDNDLIELYNIRAEIEAGK